MQLIRSLIRTSCTFQGRSRYEICYNYKHLCVGVRSMASIKKALVVIAEGSEEIEAVTPIDVFRRAGVEVSVAGLLSKSPVVCSRNVVIVPDGSLADLSSAGQVYDVIILPGGLKGAEAFAESPDIGKLLKEQEMAEGRLIGAICAAPIALKSHQIGIGKSLTSYPSVKDKIVSGSNYNYKEERVVIDGNLITSRGPGTALEFSLAIVGILFGQEKASELGKVMLDFKTVTSS